MGYFLLAIFIAIITLKYGGSIFYFLKNFFHDKT